MKDFSLFPKMSQHPCIFIGMGKGIMGRETMEIVKPALGDN